VPSSVAEWAAVVLALAYVLLATRQSRWCWLPAAASSAIYLTLFFDARLPMQALLNGYYVLMAGYGWLAWGAQGGAQVLRVTSWPRARHAALLAVLTAGSLLYSSLVEDARGPWLTFADAWVAAGSVVATWLMARKVLENWLYWVLFDLAAMVLYWSQDFAATTGLYFVYVVLAVRGYLAWRRDATSDGVAPA
jgi:nicotinamide mononucleotide transporter